MTAVSRMPGFTADGTLEGTASHHRGRSRAASVESESHITPALPMPYCHWERVVCGSALPGPRPNVLGVCLTIHDSGPYLNFAIG